MIISVTGLPGSGKTTVRNALADHFGYTRYSMGDLWGKLAQERGMTIGQANAALKSDPSIDRQVDEYQSKLAETEDNFVIDSRLAWHFIPRSIKIFLNVDLDEAARRIFESRKNGNVREDEPNYRSVDEVRAAIEKRTHDDDARYRQWYGVGYLDRSKYDLVIDTTHTPANEVVAMILTFLKDSATLRA